MIICVNNQILLEYEETFERFWGAEVTNNLLGLFESSDNFERVTVSYNWELISKDKDDNKFVDTYIAASADRLISNDSSITNLKNNSFPSLNILRLDEFSLLLKS